MLNKYKLAKLTTKDTTMFRILKQRPNVQNADNQIVDAVGKQILNKHIQAFKELAR